MIKFRHQFCKAHFMQEIVPCYASCLSGRFFLFPTPIPSNDSDLENIKVILTAGPVFSGNELVGINQKPVMQFDNF